MVFDKLQQTKSLEIEREISTLLLSPHASDLDTNQGWDYSQLCKSFINILVDQHKTTIDQGTTASQVLDTGFYFELGRALTRGLNKKEGT